MSSFTKNGMMEIEFHIKQVILIWLEPVLLNRILNIRNMMFMHPKGSYVYSECSLLL